MKVVDNTKKSIKQNKRFLIFIAIFWAIVAILLVAPIAMALATKDQGPYDGMTNFVENFIKETITFTTFFRLFGNGEAFLIFLKAMIPYTIGAIILSLLGYKKTKPKGEYYDKEHGSSDWSVKGEQYKVLSKDKGIILAKDNCLPLDKRGNINTLIVGGSGSGKSSGYSIPNAYQMLGSYVFTDPKGELYDATAGYLKSHGYDVKVLNLVNPANSDGYNPLMHVSSELDVDVIANTVVKGQSSESKSDPYWDDMAEMLLKALIYYLIATRPEEEQNLASCSELVRAANSNGGSNLLTELINQLPYDHPARMYYKSIEIAPEKTYGSILSSLQSKLGKFDSKDIAEVTSTDTIDFESIGKKKTAVYVISSDTHTAYDFLLTIFFSQMIQQLYNFADLNGGRLSTPVFFILDEFANIGRIPDFDKKISTSRSRGIQFSVILQNLDQLEAVYEKSYETIMGNCDTHVFLGSNSYKTVEYFSKALGEKTISRENKGTNKDKHYHKQGYNYSDQIMGRALMTPDELRRMDNNECIIYEKGIKPVKSGKYYFFDNPKMLKELNVEKLDHNNFDAGVRGEWRKYNPYNPYVPETDQRAVENLKVESLDDLFEDEVEEKNPIPEEKVQQDNETVNLFDFDDVDMVDDENDNTEKETSKENQMFTEDIQKELEAKFDELFGPMDE